MEITLTPVQERIVRRAMASGRYASPEAVVEDALTSWSRQVTESSGPMSAEVPSHQTCVQELNQAVREAQEELGRGEYRDLDAGELDTLLEGIRETGRKHLAAAGGVRT